MRGDRKLTPDWRDKIRVGDVLLEGGRLQSPRVVREVTYRNRGKNVGILASVTFAIKRCSWTRRPYTVVDRPALKDRGFVPAGIRVKAKAMTLQDKRLQACIGNYKNRRLSCCDVRGML